MGKLTKDFFRRDTLEAALALLGRYLVRERDGERLVCRITETEAYIGAIDKACHAYGGKRTARTEILYGEPGICYVYLIYGMYNCLNFITEDEGTAAGVLIRGGEAVYGKDTIAELRFGRPFGALSPYQRKNFLNGPGKLCKGLDIDRSLNGLVCGSDALYIVDELPELGLGPRPEDLAYKTGPRIGVDYAEEARDFPWRFYI